jgi:hypothetical protein
MSKRQDTPMSERVPIVETQQTRNHDALLVASTVFFLIFLFMILPLIRIALGEPPT